MFYNDKFYRKAFARGGESRWGFESVFLSYTKVTSNIVCNYYHNDFIRRDGLRVFDIVQSAFGENINMTVKKRST